MAISSMNPMKLYADQPEGVSLSFKPSAYEGGESNQEQFMYFHKYTSCWGTSWFETVSMGFDYKSDHIESNTRILVDSVPGTEDRFRLRYFFVAAFRGIPEALP